MCSSMKKKLIPIVTTEQTGLLIQGGGYEREGLHIDDKVCSERNSNELWNGDKDNGVRGI